jgi:hypothetical protein
MTVLCEITHFIDGHRDACMLYLVMDRLVTNSKMLPEEALDLIKGMWKDGFITLINQENPDVPDWSDDSTLIQLTQKGYELI